MQITLAWLQAQTPCIPEHIELFRREWGESVEISRATFVRAVQLGFQLPWLAPRILAPEPLARFRVILADDGERERLRDTATAAEPAERERILPGLRERLREARANAEAARRVVVDPAIERYQDATAGELQAYKAFLALKDPGESHEPGLERFRAATRPALEELRAVEAQANADRRAALAGIEQGLAEATHWRSWTPSALAAHAMAEVLNLP